MVALFTSESVSAGHPDKLCDAISDSIVDACLRIDSSARVAVETLVKGMPEHALIVLAGEVTLNGKAPDYEAIARETAVRIGIITTQLAWMQAVKNYVWSMSISQLNRQISLKELMENHWMMLVQAIKE